MVNLQRLVLAYNSFSGRIPVEICNCSALSDIELCYFGSTKGCPKLTGVPRCLVASKTVAILALGTLPAYDPVSSSPTVVPSAAARSSSSDYVSNSYIYTLIVLIVLLPLIIAFIYRDYLRRKFCGREVADDIVFSIHIPEADEASWAQSSITTAPSLIATHPEFSRQVFSRPIE